MNAPKRIRYKGQIYEAVESNNTENTQNNIVEYDDVVYHGCNHPTLQWVEGVSPEIGLHCGTLAQALKRGDNIFELHIQRDKNKTLYLNKDILTTYGGFEVPPMLSKLHIITDDESQKLISQMRIYSGDTNKYVKYSNLLRQLLLDKGYTLVSYPNGEEGLGESVIILTPQIIKEINKIK